MLKVSVRTPDPLTQTLTGNKASTISPNIPQVGFIGSRITCIIISFNSAFAKSNISTKFSTYKCNYISYYNEV